MTYYTTQHSVLLMDIIDQCKYASMYVFYTVIFIVSVLNTVRDKNIPNPPRGAGESTFPMSGYRGAAEGSTPWPR